MNNLLVTNNAAKKIIELLNLEVCKRVTDKGIQNIARTSKLKLKHLNIGGCIKISNISFQIVGEHLKNLIYSKHFHRYLDYSC